ncbi:MAG TPA: hypothetical protein VGD84_16010 [Pseudonocardiaceae bacterium]
MATTCRSGDVGARPLAFPTAVRWGKPETYALRAIERLGPAATPSVRRLPPG